MPSESTSDHSAETTTSELDRNRLADLIADGELPFPQSISAEEALRLATKVRERRRTTLVDFLARQIAQQLCDHPPEMENYRC